MLEPVFNKVAVVQVCNVIKKRLQHRCFPVNIAKSLRAPILIIICERLPQSLELFCKDFVDISYENASFGILEDSTAATYLFLNYNCILSSEISFFGLMATNSVLTKHLTRAVFIAQISHYENLTALHKLISFTIDESDQVKISREIMPC